MYQLTDEQIQHFHTKGWVGPLDTFTPDEIGEVRRCLLENSQIVTLDGLDTLGLYNNIYEMSTSRDLHLFHEPIRRPFTDPRIVQRLTQLGEPDLLLWRTNVFAKLVGMGGIKWHQVREYYWSGNIDYEKPCLIYPDAEEGILNLTVWLAIEDATLESGCMRFANGTHRHKFEVLEAVLPAEEGIFAGINSHRSVFQLGKHYASTFKFEQDDWEVEAVPAQAGQIIIFTESVMHSSLPNRSDSHRLAVNARYIRPSVQIYPHRCNGDFIDQNDHNIEKHFSILVAGQDKYGCNVVRDQHNLDEIEIEFQVLSNLIRFGHVALPKDRRQLQIQALQKQVTLGNCRSAEPNPITHPQQYLQWQAWCHLKDINKVDAMLQFNDLVASLPQQKNYTGVVSSHVYPNIQTSKRSAEEIKHWLILQLAGSVGIHPDEVNLNSPFERYGLTSVDAAGLTGELMDWIGVDLQPRLLYEYPTIEMLTEFLVKDLQQE